MKKSIKIRLHPTTSQEKQLFQAAGTARFIYNWTIDIQKKHLESNRMFLANSIIRKSLTVLKKSEFSWLYEISNNVAKQAVKDACIAYERHHKGLTDYPKYKRKHNTRPSFYQDPAKLKLNSSCILVEKIGWVSIKPQSFEHLSNITNPRIFHDGKYWFLTLCIDCQPLVPIVHTTRLGIDFGLNYLAVCSDETFFENINNHPSTKHVCRTIKRARAQAKRKLLINKQGKEFVKTRNLVKLERKIKKLQRKEKNIQMNHIHQVTHAVCMKRPERIIIEDLHMQELMKWKTLYTAFKKQKLHLFRTILTYKCEYYSIPLQIANVYYPSSKRCSNCGHVKTTLTLYDCHYTCEICGFTCNRDLNAAINLRDYCHIHSFR